MNAASNKSAAKGLRGWWASPPRRGMHRLIAPWEYRHLLLSGAIRVTGGGLATAGGAICVAYGAYPWAALFVILGLLNVAGGCWYVSIDRSISARPGA